MNRDEAKRIILDMLRQNGWATNAAMIAAIGEDENLFKDIRQELIMTDVADDKKGVGLIYIGSDVSSSENTAEVVSSKQSSDSGTLQPRRIFISYGRADAQELASKLQEDLEARGHAVWLDKQQIRSGQSWEEQIESAIMSSDVFVALLTPHAVRRPDGVCLGEINLARETGIKIIPVMVIETQPPLSIYRLDWIDLRNWQEQAQYTKGLQRLIEAIEH